MNTDNADWNEINRNSWRLRGYKKPRIDKDITATQKLRNDNRVKIEDKLMLRELGLSKGDL
jgi:hypothetical protein